MQGLYMKTTKLGIVERKSKKVFNKWKMIPWSWIGRLHIVQMKIFPKLTYRFNVNLVYLLAGVFFSEMTN